MSDAGERVSIATRQRAAVYAHLFRVLREELGEERAIELLSRAIYAHGKEKSEKGYSPEARGGDLVRAAREFSSPDPVKVFQFGPRVDRADGQEAVIALTRCPLVDQWKEMGLSPRDTEILCRIARSVDFGTWEGALGFRLAFEGTRGEGKEECILCIRTPGPGE